MDTGEEIVIIEGGPSTIDIRGGSFDCFLLIDGQPVALNWQDCSGSVGQYLVRAGVANCETKIHALREVVDGGFQPSEEIAPQIQPLLKLFAPGRYRLQYHQSCPDCGYHEFDSSFEFSKAHVAFYPVHWEFVFTQAVDSLDKARVNYYRDRIKNGQKPIALVASVADGWCQYVIDGHHKLTAYNLEKVEPATIDICRLDAPKLSADTFRAHVGPSHPLGGHYFRVKREYD